MATICVLEKVSENAPTLRRQNRFGMKLHAVNGPGPVPKPHDCAVLRRARRHLELLGQAGVGDNQRVITGSDEWTADTAEDTPAVMLDRRRFAVHRTARTNDGAAEHRTDGLMAETDAEHRRVRTQLANHVHAHPGLFRPPGAR